MFNSVENLTERSEKLRTKRERKKKQNGGEQIINHIPQATYQKTRQFKCVVHGLSFTDTQQLSNN